jgi:hypothetical protein
MPSIRSFPDRRQGSRLVAAGRAVIVISKEEPLTNPLVLVLHRPFWICAVTRAADMVRAKSAVLTS